jgi:hypothetical protein
MVGNGSVGDAEVRSDTPDLDRLDTALVDHLLGPIEDSSS